MRIIKKHFSLGCLIISLFALSLIFVLNHMGFELISVNGKIIGYAVYFIAIIIGLVGLCYSEKKNTYAIVFILVALVTTAGIMLGGFVQITALETVNSPNSHFQLISIDHDEGAFGGSTIVTVKRVYFDIARRDYKTIYVSNQGGHPDIKWVNDRKVVINSREMDIYDDPVWDARN